jgi:hypothetical protein
LATDYGQRRLDGRSDPRAAALSRALSASQDELRERRFLETRDLVAGHVAALVEAGWRYRRATLARLLAREGTSPMLTLQCTSK